jgi:hypothetical protein
LNDVKGASLAVIKPEDEEPYAINNPKKMGSIVEEVSARSDDVAPLLGAITPERHAKKTRSKRHTKQALTKPLPTATTSGPKAVQQYIRRGIFPGEGAAREVAAFLLDHDHQAGVPPTALVLARHQAFNVSEHYMKARQRAQEEREAALLALDTRVSSPMEDDPDISRRKSSFVSNTSDLPVVTAGGVRTLVQFALPPVKQASLQLYVPHACSAEDVGPSLWPADEVHKIAILDIRLGNTDRNNDNMLVRAFFDGDPELERLEAATPHTGTPGPQQEDSVGFTDMQEPYDRWNDEDDEEYYDAAHDYEDALLSSKHRRHNVKKSALAGSHKGHSRGSKNAAGNTAPKPGAGGTPRKVASETSLCQELTHSEPSFKMLVDEEPVVPIPSLILYWKHRLEDISVNEELSSCKNAEGGCSIASSVLQAASSGSDRHHLVDDLLEEGVPRTLGSSVPRSQIADTETYPALASALSGAEETENLSDSTSQTTTKSVITPLFESMEALANLGLSAAAAKAVTSSINATVSAVKTRDGRLSNADLAAVGRALVISMQRGGVVTPMLSSVQHSNTRRLHSASIDSTESSESSSTTNFTLGPSAEVPTSERTTDSHPVLAAYLSASLPVQVRQRTSSVPDRKDVSRSLPLSSIPSCGILLEENTEADKTDSGSEHSAQSATPTPAYGLSLEYGGKGALSMHSKAGSRSFGNDFSRSSVFASMRASSSGAASPPSQTATSPANVARSLESVGFTPAPPEIVTVATAAAWQDIQAAATAPPMSSEGEKPPVKPWRSTRLEALRSGLARAEDSGASLIEGGTPTAGHAPPPMFLDTDDTQQSRPRSSSLSNHFPGLSRGGVHLTRYKDEMVSSDPRLATATAPLSAKPGASPSSLLSLAGRACDASEGPPDIKMLKTAKKLELVPIDHGLCLPHVNALDDINCSWVNWKQAKEPLSDARRRYVLHLAGRADTLLMSATLGQRSRPWCLLTMRLCTTLLQEGVKAGLSLSEIGMMMSRGTGVGVLPRKGARGPHIPGLPQAEHDASLPDLSGLEQAYRKAKGVVKRERKVRARRQLFEARLHASMPHVPHGRLAADASQLQQQQKMPWNVPSKGPKRRQRGSATSASMSALQQVDHTTPGDDASRDPFGFLPLHDAINDQFRDSLPAHFAIVVAARK